MTGRSRTHDLKTWPEFYEEVWTGRKTVEVRKEDRPFAVGDMLALREWDPDTLVIDPATQVESRGDYTGRGCLRQVTHVLHGWGVQPGYVAMSITDRLSAAAASSQSLPNHIETPGRTLAQDVQLRGGQR